MSGLALTLDTDSSQLTAQYTGAMWDPQNKTHLVLTDVDVVPAYFVSDNEDLYVPISDLVNDASVVSEIDYRNIRKRVFQRFYTPCVQNLVAPTYDVPIAGWVIGVIIAAAVIVVAVIIVLVWRLKRKATTSEDKLLP